MLQGESPTNLHDLGHVSCVRSVLHRSRTTSHCGRWGSRWSKPWSGRRVINRFTLLTLFLTRFWGPGTASKIRQVLVFHETVRSTYIRSVSAKRAAVRVASRTRVVRSSLSREVRTTPLPIAYSLHCRYTQASRPSSCGRSCNLLATVVLSHV